MFYDNRVNQIREKRRVMNKIREKLEAIENGDGDIDVDADIESPSIYLTLKVAEIVMQNNECLIMKANNIFQLQANFILYFRSDENILWKTLWLD